MDASFNKLRILKMSLENRLEEFPSLAKSLPPGGEQNGDTRPVLPRPAQLTGTFYLKLHGVEGLLDLYTLRQMTADIESKSTPPRTYSASQVKNSARNFMTLPTPTHREKEKEREREREKEKEKERERTMTAEDENLGNNTWYRRGSKHGRNKNTALTKQHSLDHIDEASS